LPSKKPRLLENSYKKQHPKLGKLPSNKLRLLVKKYKKQLYTPVRSLLRLKKPQSKPLKMLVKSSMRTASTSSK
jgi:hypothetical protein